MPSTATSMRGRPSPELVEQIQTFSVGILHPLPEVCRADQRNLESSGWSTREVHRRDRHTYLLTRGARCVSAQKAGRK
jgi:hypothetical protein